MKQRTWFITGINSGFGRHMTEQLLEMGDKVAGTVRNMNSVDNLKEKYGNLLQWLILMLQIPQQFMKLSTKLSRNLEKLMLL